MVEKMGVSVTIHPLGTVLKVRRGTSILATALMEGLPFPHSCRSGTCGSCKVRLVSGEMDMNPYSSFALTEREREAGFILACRSTPWEDCEIALIDDDEVVAHPQRYLRCRVDSLDRPTHDIVIVRLEIKAGGLFQFSAGQYASVTLPGQLPRDYSMANQPGDPYLEFHIRASGEVSRFAYESLKVGDTVRVEGPLGSAHLRERHTGPILAVAGGSGLAPMLSIVSTALAADPVREIHFYFGMPRERDLYGLATLDALTKRHPNLKRVIVLSDPGGPTDRLIGKVGEVAANALPALNGAKAYLAGPPAMVEATTALLKEKGLAAEHIHADAFYTEAEKQALESAA